MALEFKGGTLAVDKNNYSANIQFRLDTTGWGPTISFYLDFETAKAVAELIILELKKVEVERKLIAPPPGQDGDDVPF